MSVSVILPWPPAGLTPNGQHGHWHAKASAARDYKRACWAACKAAGLRQMDADAVEVGVIFQPPSLRRYDLDNQLARIKQALDAVSEAIGIDDGRWVRMTLERGDKTPGGAVIVSIVPSRWQSVGGIAQSLATRVKACHEKEAGPKALPTPTTPDHGDDVRSINDGC